MIYIAILIVGLIIGYLFSTKKSAKETGPNRTERKEENKQEILTLLETQHPLTNNQVEQKLGISDATVTRYFEELEKEGKVRQVGKTGRSVYYEKA